MSMKPAHLILENGERFDGFCPTWQTERSDGEVVFSTGMTGYYESLTDPSYTGQILVFTYPLIGNYGVPPKERWESEKIHVRGVIVSEAVSAWSHHEGTQSLLDWLKSQNVAIITGIDTRALTKILREAGTMLGAIQEHECLEFWNPAKEHLVAKVSTQKVQELGDGQKRIIVVDCGMKENILRMLKKLPISIRRVPYNYDYSQEEFDGVFLSNGPGDPMQCPETVDILRRVLKRKKPVFGICLGTQMLALASGAKTYKLPYGHRGHNQPCEDLKSRRCFITSQNHGYAIAEESLGNDWDVSFRNLNDGSIEGIRHKIHPFFAVQFHPEAAPGPTDTSWLFEEFYQML